MERIYEFYYNYKTKVKMYLCFILIVGIFGLLYFYYISKDKQNNVDRVEEIDKVVEKDKIKKEEDIKKIFVDIKGEVSKPGVYEIEYGKRVIDIIDTAGGLKDDANTRFINLAKILEDGEVIVIYSNKEIEKAKEPDIVYVDVPCVCEEVKNDACLESNISKNDEDKININEASLEDLKKLEGIGDAKANSIIEYRNKNGKFKKIEDILNVSGISEKLFESIKDKITVN